jgi:tRNA1Val (adenine37-N6)-methyltransferase
MPNNFFQFKQFTIHQDKCAMKVTTDGCLFGAWAAAQIAVYAQGNRCLDIGAGTGLTSLMIAQENPRLRIDAIEVEAGAAAQAGENVRNSPWAGTISIHHADIRNFTPSQPYDFIASNPPFYEKELKSTDELRKLAHHEGLGLESLLEIIHANLSEQGMFFLLLPFKRLGEFHRLTRKIQLGIVEEVHVRQSPTHSCFRVLVHGKHLPRQHASSIPTLVSHLSIWNHAREYTNEFGRLLGEYYLGMRDER